jgi:hypothetical protein
MPQQELILESERRTPHGLTFLKMLCVPIVVYKLTGRPAHDGLAQVDYSGRRSGALLCGSGAQYLRGQPRGLFCCGRSIILSSQTVAIEQPRCRRLGRLSPGQSGPRMWSSTLQRSVRLGCRTALPKLRGMTPRPVRAQAGPPADARIVHVDCATAISINQNSSAHLLWEFPCFAY